METEEDLPRRPVCTCDDCLVAGCDCTSDGKCDDCMCENC